MVTLERLKQLDCDKDEEGAAGQQDGWMTRGEKDNKAGQRH